MKNIFSKLFLKIREALGLEEIIFLSGMWALYAGVCTQFGRSMAQIVIGTILVAVSLWLASKGSGS